MVPLSEDDRIGHRSKAGTALTHAILQLRDLPGPEKAQRFIPEYQYAIAQPRIQGSTDRQIRDRHHIGLPPDILCVQSPVSIGDGSLGGRLPIHSCPTLSAFAISSAIVHRVS
jgi:hypothetical protein